MSAETLRKAAALMRERAEDATAGPWEALVLGSEGYAVVQSADPSVKRRRKRPASVTYETFDECRTDAEHIASMHPGVTLAVADWLDAAWRAEVAMQRQLKAMGKRGHAYGYDEALAVARAYLGEGA